MSRYYLDTSAAAKLLVRENESAALATWADSEGNDLVATLLLETELRRFAQRHQVPQSSVTAILDRVSLHDLPPSLFQEAGILAGRWLRTLDALHLVGAIRLDVDAVVTYDQRLTAAAGEIGLNVLAPNDS